MAQGTVKWFSHEKGYGFIRPHDGGEDVFVHFRSIVGGGFRGLEEGENVAYEASRDAKGPRATNVRKV
jgi:cold shock protein